MSQQPPATTFLFTDIEGSTRLWERYPEAMRRALARHDALLRASIEAHGGTIFKTVGDAFCAAFDESAQALEAALAIQQQLRDEPWEEIEPLRVRVALHYGVAERRQGDFFGPPLNRVARLLAAGHGGQILLSRAAYEALKDALPTSVTVVALGTHRLRDLIQPEHLFQVAAPELPTDFPPLRSLEAFAHNLPIQLTSFIGREALMLNLKRLLLPASGVEPHRLITLTGVGGTGKSRLSLQVAAEVLDAFPDGAWLVELAQLSDPALVPKEVAAMLGVREEGTIPLIKTLVDALRPRKLLLLLDNCEHLIETCAQLAESILLACPHIHILASSREPLGIAGELPFAVPSLSLPASSELPPLEQLAHFEAVRLFVERAAAVEPRFALTEANAPLVTQICQRLDGIPLAIELAAARVRVLSVEQIARRLDDRFRLLTGGSRTALPRQQTLRALIDWSYDMLPPAEAMLLRRLSLFAGGWTLEAAERVCLGKGLEEYEILDGLTHLVNKSLVVVERGEGEVRYRLLETIRQYARERLLEAYEAEPIRDRHLGFFLHWAEQAEAELWHADQRLWLDRLEAEHDNLAAALEWSLVTEGGVQAGLRLAVALGQFWSVRGYWTEGSEWVRRLLSADGAGAPTVARAKALNLAGATARSQGNMGVAEEWFKQSLALSQAIGYEQGVAQALGDLGAALTRGNDTATTWELMQEGLERFRALGDKRGMIVALGRMGFHLTFSDQPASARPYLDENLRLCREFGHHLGMAGTLVALGRLEAALGHDELAHQHLTEALAIFRENDDRPGVLSAIYTLANVTMEVIGFDASLALYEEGLTLARRLGNRAATMNGLNAMGEMARQRNDPVAACALYEEALQIAQHIGLEAMLPIIYHNLGYARLRYGEVEQASLHFQACLEIYARTRSRIGLGLILAGLAAVRVARSLANPPALPTRWGRAALLLGAGEACYKEIGRFPDPTDQREWEHTRAALLAALGAEGYQRALAEGEALSLDEAVALAQAEGVPTEIGP